MGKLAENRVLGPVSFFLQEPWPRVGWSTVDRKIVSFLCHLLSHYFSFLVFKTIIRRESQHWADTHRCPELDPVCEMESSGASLTFGLISMWLSMPAELPRVGRSGAQGCEPLAWCPLSDSGALSVQQGHCTPRYVGQALGPRLQRPRWRDETRLFHPPLGSGAGLGRAHGKRDVLSSLHRPRDRGSFGPEEGQP